MQQFTYKALGKLQSTKPQAIRNEAGEKIMLVERVYDNGLKKLLDGYFDYRYFLKYRVTTNEGVPLFEAKKIFRRGKVWFEAKDLVSNETYVVNYENWRIGVPELFVSGQTIKMKIDKEMEDWSNFIVAGEIVARWKASYDETSDEFTAMLEVADISPIQNTAFFIAIAQAALFIGV